MKKKKWILFAIIPIYAVVAATIVLIVRSPKYRVSSELKNIIKDEVRLGNLLENSEIVEYREFRPIAYAKLKLPIEEYNFLKQRFLSDHATDTDKDYSDEILNGDSSYRYHSASFLSQLKTMNNIRQRHELDSMNLDDYEELLFMFRFVAVHPTPFTGTTGEANYILVKENDGNCYLYYIKVA